VDNPIKGATMRQELFMARRKRRKFTPEFKVEAVRLARAGDRSIQQQRVYSPGKNVWHVLLPPSLSVVAASPERKFWGEFLIHTGAFRIGNEVLRGIQSEDGSEDAGWA
jgi:hypothetical protein